MSAKIPYDYSISKLVKKSAPLYKKRILKIQKLKINPFKISPDCIQNTACFAR